LEDPTAIVLETIAHQTPSIDPASYQDWIATNGSLSNEDRRLIAERILTLRVRPKISLLLADNGRDDCLHESLVSIAAQIYPEVETIIAARTDRIDAVSAVATRTAVSEGRPLIAKVKDNPVVANAEMIAFEAATGTFVGFMLPGDRLAPEALAEMVCALERRRKAMVIYSDEDWIDGGGIRSNPRFKTAWDPEAQLTFDLLGRLCLMRRDVIADVGGLRLDRAPAAYYDLHCRVTAVAGSSRIVHVPSILYHRKMGAAVTARDRVTKLAAYSTAARAICAEAVLRTEGVEVDVTASPIAAHLNRIVWPLPDPAPLVSVLVPTRDRPDLLRTCARGVLEETAYSPIELIILDNESAEPETLALLYELQRDPRVRVLPTPGAFNYSRINNEGVSAARGEIIVFLNNDIEVVNSEWLREMVSLAIRPEVGCVGAKLLYADRRIQHAGVVLAPGSLAACVFRLKDALDVGYDAQLGGVRGYLVVTAACLAIRKRVFEEVGGFDDKNLKVSFNDVDLCLKVADFGYRVVWTPFAELFHLEGASRGFNQSPDQAKREREELEFLAARWIDRFQCDPFHNPNLLHTWDDGLRLSRPRHSRAWASTPA
jgi:GT2 family glycosyltransferase